jgi:adenylate cyclase
MPLELEPNNANVHYTYGFLFLRSLRRSDEAVAEIRQAETLDPLGPAIPNALGTVLIEAGRYDEAIVALNRALALNADFVPAHQSLARLYRLTGKGDRAITESRRAIELGARTERAALAESYVVAGRQADAKAVLDELVAESTRSRRGAFGVAMVWVALGDNARALDWLERAYEEHDLNMVFLNAFPELDRLRTNPRFQTLVRRVGIPS